MNNRSDKAKTFTIRLGSTDYDVIDKARMILNTNALYKRSRNKYYSKSYKVFYQTGVNGYRAIGWMMTLYPLLGSRRRERIKELLTFWKAHVPRFKEKI